MAPNAPATHDLNIINGNSKPSLRPRPIAFAHAVLRTTKESFKDMVAWYKEVLNAEVIFEDDVFVFLRYDYEHHRLAIFWTPETKAKEGVVSGLEHLAFTYPTLTAMAQTYKYLATRPEPIVPFWAVNHGMSSSMYYMDPDKNKVELQIDNFDSAQEADDFMRSKAFIENPVGADIDPPSWAERILSKSGPNGEEGLTPEEIRDIKSRPETGPRTTFPGM
jgi:Glyoxalase/Bleomycin resistance protein/Dioxygenase superfamily